jgi:hypothetical protein
LALLWQFRKVSRAPEIAPPWALRLGIVLAFAVPALLGVWHANAVPHWDDDVAVVRALGGVQVGAEGLVSAALASLSTLLPVGSRLVRAALVSALAAGAASVLVFQCALFLTRGSRGSSFGDVLVAAFAAFGAALLPSLQIEASRVGGATVAAALGLALLRTLLCPSAVAVRGVLFGLLLVESRPTALLGGLVLVATTLRERPTSLRGWIGPLPWSAATVAFALLPSLLERRVLGRGFDFGLSLSLPLGELEAQSSWLLELGVLCSALALTGSVLSLFRPRLQPAVLTMCAVIGVSAIVADRGVRLFALSCASLLAALGVRAVLQWLSVAPIPLAPTLRRLSALALGCLLLVTAEDGQRAVGRRSISGAAAWTSEAFGNLPPGTLVISDSPATAWRLWASRVTEGTRPDVMLVPSPLLGHGNLARELLRVEPRIEGLIRDYASKGTASELSLSQLADTRPLKVELDHDWDRRLLSTLTPDGVWSDVAPHALGRSDRKSSYGSVQKAYRRVLRQAKTDDGEDKRTLDRVTLDLYRHALVSATLGDTKLAERILRELARISPDHPEWEALRAKLRDAPRGATSVRAMLE